MTELGHNVTPLYHKLINQKAYLLYCFILAEGAVTFCSYWNKTTKGYALYCIWGTPNSITVPLLYTKHTMAILNKILRIPTTFCYNKELWISFTRGIHMFQMIPDINDHNIGRDKNYTNLGFVLFPPAQCGVSTLNYATSASCHIPFYFLINYRSLFRR